MSDIHVTQPASGPAPDQGLSRDAILRLLDRPLSAEELNAASAIAAQPVHADTTGSVRLLLFRIGDEVAAIPAKALRRVTTLARPTPVPHRTGGVLRGVCNIRGELVLCADLHRLLDLGTVGAGAPAADSRRMIVLGTPENSWAFEADALMGVESVSQGTFRAPPVTIEHAINDYTSAVTDIGGQTVSILDAERILAGFKAGLI